jgi:hypothetical protein
MWRAFFLAIGIFLIILGIECLAVEKVYLKIHDEPPTSTNFLEPSPKVGPAKQLTPQSWHPWSLLSIGVVICLYSFTIPRRIQGK